MRTKNKKTRARRKSIAILDADCRAQIFDRDGGLCQWCGSDKNGQWAHILSRRDIALRHDPDNSVVLCAGCHLRWHHEPLIAVTWFVSKFMDRYERLLQKRQNHSKIITAKDLKERAASLNG